MKRKNVYFICHLTDIFIRCTFLTGKMAFDGHGTHEIPVLVGRYGGASVHYFPIHPSILTHIQIMHRSSHGEKEELLLKGRSSVRHASVVWGEYTVGIFKRGNTHSRNNQVWEHPTTI